VAAILTQPACTADLETECVGGDGTCEGFETTSSSSSTTGSGGGNAGGGGAAPVCYEGCDTEAVSGSTGEFPCEVEAIMDNCRRCHTDPPMNGAPFPLDTYEQSQELYAGKAVWGRLKAVLVDNPDFMPLSPPKLTALEKIEVLDNWACQCAPPRAAGETCN
jgi:hypothetical protein